MKLFKELREQYSNMLLEDRIDFLKQQHKDKLPTEHDTLAKIHDSDKIIDHFSKKADPSTSKNYTQWLINQYKNQKIRQEDAPQLKSTLNDFEKVKNNLEKKDINQYKDIGELRDAVATQKGHVEKATKAKAAAAERKGADLEKMYDQDGVQGFKIPNKESSIRNYGPGGEQGSTNWCTAANSSNNMFNHYKGGKYTMHFPNGEKLQFHHQSGQVKDDKDSEIQEGDPRFAPYEEHIHNFIKQTEPLESDSSITHRFKVFTPEEVEGHIKDHEERLKKGGWFSSRDEGPIRSVASKAKLSDDQFNRIRAMGTREGSWSESPKGELYKNPNLSHGQVSQLLKDEQSDARTKDYDFPKNPSIKDENLDKLVHDVLNHKSHHDINVLANNPNLKDHHITSILKSKPDSKNYLALNKSIHFSPENQKLYAKENEIHDYDSDLSHLAKREDLSPEMVDRIVKSKDPHAVKEIIKNPSVQLSKEHVDHILKNDEKGANAKELFLSHHDEARNNPEVFNKAIEHAAPYDMDKIIASKNLKKEHIAKMIDDPKHHPDLAESDKLSSDNINHIIDNIKDGPSARKTIDKLTQNKKLKAEHLNKLIDAGHIHDRGLHSVKDPIYEHPATNADILHKMYDKGTNQDKTSVLHHPAAQASHFAKAIAEPGLKLHGAISSAPGAPPSVLDKMADSPLSYVRENVANHKNTSQDTLKRLKDDAEPNIAKIAAKKYKGQ